MATDLISIFIGLFFMTIGIWILNYIIVIEFELHENFLAMLISVILFAVPPALAFFAGRSIYSPSNSDEKKQIAAEKADQMYYEEMFSQPKMNLLARNPFIIIPAYDKRFIGMHPDLKEYFVRKVPGKEIFSTELNIDFADGTWQLSVDERTTELVKAQFSKDGKFVLVSGMKEGNSIINISREDETYSGSILVRVEEPEEWYEKLQEEIKLYSRENRR